QHIQIAVLRNGMRDLVEGYAVHEAVGKTMRIVVAEQLLNRLGVAEEISEGNAAVAGLGTSDAERRERRRSRIVAEHEDEIRGVERSADAQSLGDEGIVAGARVGSRGVVRRRHGVAS